MVSRPPPVAVSGSGALRRQHIVESGAVSGIAVMQHVATLTQCAEGVVDSVASQLRHPGFGRVPGEAGEGDAPGFQVEEKEDVVGRETTPGRHFRR